MKNADVIIIIGGISAQMEGEGGDKADIELPKVQQRLVRAMHATGRPVVFVNCSGSAIAFGCVEGQYDALLQAWYAGQGGAKALKGFRKLSLKPGETKKAVITLDNEAFEYYDENIDELAVRPGRYRILYGTSSRDKDLQSVDFVVR